MRRSVPTVAALRARAFPSRLALLGVIVCGGCETLTEAMAEQRMVGIIHWQEAPVPGGVESIQLDLRAIVAAPDTVAAGVPFAATVRTFGLSGCWHEAGAEITYASRLAAITPYDRVVTRIGEDPAVCTGAIVQLHRTVQIVFTEAGAALLRVNGRLLAGGEFSSAVPASVERSIVVR